MVKDNNILIQNLSQTKDNKKILDNINLTIPFNSVICLVGPSGCGKTSLLRVIAGLDKFKLGKIFFDNKLVSSPEFSIPTENRNVGLVFQESNLFPHLNIFKNVSFGSKKENFKDIQKETFEILKKIGLPHFSNIFPHQLSGGQKQLVAVARSLIRKPKLLMMDEPFANLDQRLKNKIRDIVLHLLQKTRTTALIVTHDPDDAMFMGDFIAVMNKGKILQFDTPVNIYNKPNSSFVARFFGETLFLKSKINNNKVDTLFGPIKIKDSNFHEAFHHSEQGIMFGLSQAQTIKHIVQLARQNNAVYFYGAMLDIYTPRTMCRHCNTGLIGIKNTHEQGFIHDLSARLTQKNIEPGGNDHLFLDVRVSATSPAQHTNLEPFKLTSDSNVVHEYSSEIAVRPILQALNSDVIRKRRKTPPEYYSGSFFSSRDFPCKKLEKALVNHPNFK